MTPEAEAILRPRWPAPASVRAAFTTRAGGISAGPWASLNLGSRAGDDPRAVAANRQRIASLLTLPSAPQWLHQVHGAGVLAARDDGRERTADAAWASEPGLVCAVQSADCLPILLCDRAGTRVAAVHGGWRGLAAGIVQRTLEALDTTPETLLAWLGPAICGSCYEVGEDVRAAFAADAAADRRGFRAAARQGHWYADLTAIARAQLAARGVPERAIFGGDLCTYEDPRRFYSFRRDGTTGRMAALIWLVSA